MDPTRCSIVAGRWLMAVTTIGLDIAKNVFQVHGVDGSGRTTLFRGCGYASA
jgi:hypothetical protein